MQFVFAGGGTGGHLYPGIALADELRRRYPSSGIRFVGSSRTIEADILSAAGHTGASIPARPFTRKPWRWPAFAVCSLAAYRQSLRILEGVKADLVIALGGYAGYWPARAARARGVPVVVLEQNVIPGKANQRIAAWAKSVCVQFKRTADHFPKGARVYVTGNPVRPEVERLSRDEGRARYGAPPDAKVLLVTGGSQGASAINELIVALARELAGIENAFIIHQTGKADEMRLRSAYRVVGLPGKVAAFFHDLPWALAAADLVVARAGATSIAEICVRGLPSVLIPFPHATDDHQWANAQELAARQAAVVFRQDAIDRQQFGRTLIDLLKDDARLATMGTRARELAVPDALDQVVWVCEEAMGVARGDGVSE